MTPTKREAALRLADTLQGTLYGDGTAEQTIDEAAALLRELAQEPQAEPVAWSEQDAVVLAHRSGFAGTYWSMGPEELVHLLNMVAHPPQQRKPLPWKPMRTAPRDGTAVLILMDGSDIPHAARWTLADDQRGSGAEGWHMTWDGYEISASSCRYWMQIPDDPNEAAHGIVAAP